MIKYNYQEILNMVSKKFETEPNFKLKEEEANFLVKKSIENNDHELVKLFLKYKVTFDSSIFEIISFAEECIFVSLVKSGNIINYSDEKIINALFLLCENKNSTFRMFYILFMLLQNKQYSELNKGNMNIFCYLCLNRKEDIVSQVLKEKIISKEDLFRINYNNRTLFDIIFDLFSFEILVDYFR